MVQIWYRYGTDMVQIWYRYGTGIFVSVVSLVAQRAYLEV